MRDSVDSYTSFAYVYDTFMDQEPYDQWADRVCSFLDLYGLPAGGAEKSRGENKMNGPDKSRGEDKVNGPDISRSENETDGPDKSRGENETDGPDKNRGENEAADPGTDEREIDERKIVVDLGCGTGKLTEILADRGYDMIGLDLSEDMLSIAQERKLRSGHDILYTLQDMRDFELYGAAGAMVSVGDSINYLLEEEGLESMFRCVERALLPGGVFVFDFKTVHLYRDVIGDRTIAEDRGDCAFIWDNYYDPETCINEYDLAVFVALPEEEGLFRRFDEVHHQRGYEPAQLRRAAERAGLSWITMQDAETGREVGPHTERVMAAVRKECRD